MKIFNVIWYSIFSVFAVSVLAYRSLFNTGPMVEKLGQEGYSLYIIFGTLIAYYFLNQLVKAVKKLRGK